MAQQERPPAVWGVTEDQYLAWRLHPVTVLLHRFLQEHSEELGRDHQAQWLQGTLDPKTDAEQRARVLVNLEVAGLEFEHLVSFYKTDDQRSKDQQDEPSTD